MSPVRAQTPRAASPRPPRASQRRISIDEAVGLALEQNLDLQVERLNPQIQDLSIAQVRPAMDADVPQHHRLQRPDAAPGQLPVRRRQPDRRQQLPASTSGWAPLTSGARNYSAASTTRAPPPTTCSPTSTRSCRRTQPAATPSPCCATSRSTAPRQQLLITQNEPRDLATSAAQNGRARPPATSRTPTGT